MISDILFWTFAVTSVFYVVHLGLYLIGANFYDIWQYRRLHRHRRTAKAQLNRNPLISVVISAHNEEKVLVRSLDSIWRSSYKNVQIVVVDDGSTDATLAIARRYQRSHRSVNMTVAHMRQNVGKGRALNRALQEYAKGELVMTLDADSVLTPDAISNTITYFADPNVVGVAANVRVIEEPNILGVLQTIEHLIGYRSKKFHSVANCEFVVGGVASTYRMEVLREVGFYDTSTVTEDIGLSIKITSRGNRRSRLVYGADVVAHTEGVSSFRALFKQRYRWKYGSLQNLVKYRHLIGRVDRNFTPSLTLYRLPVAIAGELTMLAGPFVWGYVIYISLAAHDPRLIVGAYFTITAYTMITLWFDEHHGFLNRLRLSIYAPMMYFVFYIMDMVQITAVMRCLYRIRSLLKQKDVGGAWVSPQRVGREVASVNQPPR